MSNPGFEKVQCSDKRLFGPRKLLLCGFAADVQSKFKALLEMIGMADLPLVWATEEQGHEILEDLVDLPDGSGSARSSALPRAVIVSGITESQLHLLMASCRKAGMKQALWAVLTPTSSGWPLQKLLLELSEEHKALSSRSASTP